VCVLVLAPSGAAEPAHLGYPNSIVVLGHSGATGYNSDPARPRVDVPDNSWATGGNPAVNSVYSRILAANPSIRAHRFNVAKDGAKVSDLLKQAELVSRIRPDVELILVQIGGNDIACDGKDAQRYQAFRSTFIHALGMLSASAPNARIFVVSEFGRPHSYVEAIKDVPDARAALTGSGPCDAFDSKGLVRAAAVAYLEEVLRGYEAQLAAGCARLVHCRYDGGALAQPVDELADLSSDWAHLSIEGTAKEAALAWSAMFDFTDQVPPVSKATKARTPRGTEVKLTAADGADIAGVEYKLVPPKRTAARVAFRRYAAPLHVPRGWSLVWRSVDMNGNTEATRSLRG
jgi:hypothetical protein